MRTTPENIKKLEQGFIFVFGSNLSGRHGKGAAKTALGWGAKWGQAAGLQGRTYGIPTKDASIRRTLRIDEIKPFVDDFINFATCKLILKIWHHVARSFGFAWIFIDFKDVYQLT